LVLVRCSQAAAQLQLTRSTPTSFRMGLMSDVSQSQPSMDFGRAIIVSRPVFVILTGFTAWNYTATDHRKKTTCLMIMITHRTHHSSQKAYSRYGTLETYKTQSQLLRTPLSRYVRSSNNYCAMFDRLIAASLALLILDSAHAQVSAPNCNNSDSSYAWVGYPCLVAQF
jgi:hypothetical protein